MENDTLPIVVSDTFNVIFETPTDLDVLANDSDPNGTLVGSTLQVELTPLRGTVTVENGLLRYTPNVDAVGSDTFTYSVADNDGNRSGEAAVQVTIMDDPNTAPTVTDDTASTLTDQPVTINVLANDSDAETAIDPDTLQIVTQPVDGTAAVVAGEITFTPGAGFNGTTDFTYTVADTEGATSEEARVTVTVAVEQPNQTPVANADTAGTAFDTPVSIDVLANDRDTDGTIDPASIAISVAPANGSAQIVNGEILYTPNAGFVGTDEIAYTVRDNENALSNVAIATVTVAESTNLAPMATADEATTDVDTPVTIDVLANDTDDAALDGASIEITQQSFDGTATVENSQIVFTPDAGFEGETDFTYRLVDGDDAASDEVTVSITVGSLIIVPPVAVDDVATTAFDTPVTVDVLANDTDADGAPDPDTIEIAVTPQNGTAAIVNGQIVYTPNAGFVGRDEIAYTVRDGDGETSNTAIVSVSVADDGNPLPVAVADTARTLIDTPVIIDVLANDTDDDPLDGSNIEITVGSFDGAATVQGNTVTFTPDAGFSGVTDFTYRLIDADGAVSEEVQATIQVDESAPPSADNDAVATAFDTPVTIDVLANDTGLDGVDPASLAIDVPPLNGTATVEDGQIVFTPNAGFVGTASFSYTVASDVGTVSDPAVVTVSVADDDNIPPETEDDRVTTSFGTAILIGVLANDTDDEDIAAATIEITTQPADGTATVEDGQVRFVPDDGFDGETDFLYRVIDADGAVSEEAVVTVTVEPQQNRAPTGIALAPAVIAEDAAGGTTIGLFGITDPDIGDMPTVSVLSGGDGFFVTDGLALQLAEDAALDFEADASYDLLVEADDGAGGTFQQTVRVTVTDVEETFVAPPGGGTVLGDAGDNAIIGSAQDDILGGGLGQDVIDLGGGRDVVRDTRAGLAGDEVIGFGPDDRVEITDGLFGRRDATVAPATGEGTGTDITVDGSTFTIADAPTGGGFQFSGTGPDMAGTRIDFVDFLPTLAEGQTIDPGEIQGIENQAYLSGATASDFLVTFDARAAAQFDNTIGVYEITDTGDLVDVRIIAPNAKTVGPVTITGVDPANDLGFFLIQNGANRLPGSVFNSDNLVFVEEDGALRLDDANDSDPALNAVLFFSHDASLNPNGAVNAVSGISNDDTGTLFVGFEDLVRRGGPSDDDFQDVVLDIEALI